MYTFLVITHTFILAYPRIGPTYVDRNHILTKNPILYDSKNTIKEWYRHVDHAGFIYFEKSQKIRL